MRFVLITDELPRPGTAGHLAMNHAILAWLRDGGSEVSVLLVRSRLHRLVQRFATARVVGPGVATRYGYVFASRPRAAVEIVGRAMLEILPDRLAGAMRRRRNGLSYDSADNVLGAFITPEQIDWCAGRLLELAPDAVLIDTIFRAPALADPRLAGLPSVILTHDVFHLRHKALIAAGYKVYPPDLPREQEAELLRAAQGIVAIQPEEAACFRDLCPDRRVCSTPMPAIACERPRGTHKIPGQLVFVGSLTLFNVDGLRWFFDEVWPLILAECETIKLDLVGDCGRAFPRLPPNVRRLGRVEDLAPVLHRSMLAISPLRVGTGLKIKILDYARHGLITVATPASLQGFAADADAPFVEVTDAAGFAAVTLARLADVSKEDEEHALNYVRRHYNVAHSFAGLAELLGISDSIDGSRLSR